MKLLLVEDSAELRTSLARALEGAGYLVDQAENGEDAAHLGGTGDYAAVVLDLGLPLVDGLTVLAGWRAHGIATPVLILTARDSWREKVQGLRQGADDYLTKPFRTEELLARIEALIRRSKGHSATMIALGDMELDLSQRRLTRQGAEIALTAHEFRTLACLALNKGRVVARAELNEHLYDDQAERDSNVVEVTIARLRRKIGARMIVTKRGHGYIIPEGERGDG
ncbi:MAG: response regulator transcription factor [Paracoccaceae bacterium]|nr:response regulator transcription factor [Paracoccaceae bacterium]